MRRKTKAPVIVAVITLILLVPLIILEVRPPVLIVTDQAFLPLYGQTRIRRETLIATLALFRRVETVSVADDAGYDTVQFAVTGVSSRPFCVLFPLRFAQAARLYRESNPQIHVVLLEGRNDEGSGLSSTGSSAGDFFIYKTDTESDFFRAGLAAAALDMDKNGIIAVFLESGIEKQAKEAFLRAINSLEKPLETRFFTSFSDFSEIPGLSCVVLAGAGAEYLEQENGVPVIFMTWIDPFLVPDDVAIVVDDSPWAQAVEAVRMVTAGIGQGQIPSKFYILKKNIDKEVLHKL